MNISIVIATHNRKSFLEILINQLQQQNIPESIKIDVIIVDDGSSDGTYEMLSNKFPDVKYIKGNGTWWWTKSVNEGLKLALNLNSDFYLLLNDDNEIDSDYLQKMVSYYSSLPKESILGSASISVEQKGKIDSAGTKKYNKILHKFTPYYKRNSMIDKHFKGIHRTWSLPGRGTLIPKGILERVGLLDENLLQYASDDDFILRAIKKGIGVYITWDAWVLNNSSMTSKSREIQSISIRNYLFSFFDRYSVNSLYKHWYIYKKHCYPVLVPLFVSYIFFSEIFSFLKSRLNK